MTKPGARAEWTGQVVNGVLADLPAAAPGSTRRFGRYQARSLDTSYTAVTDGFVLAGIAPSSDVSRFNLAILQGLIDGNLVASATAGNLGSFDSNWNYMRAAGASSFLMPVPEGDLAGRLHPTSRFARHYRCLGQLDAGGRRRVRGGEFKRLPGNVSTQSKPRPSPGWTSSRPWAT